MKKILAFSLSLFSIFIFSAVPASAQSTNLTVLTGGASNVTQTSAVLNGSYAVNVGGDRADRPQTFFQYGQTTSFGQSTVSRSHSRFSDNISVEVNNLLPNTNYYARVVGQNRNGIVYGPTISFITLPVPGQQAGYNGGTNITVIEQPNGNVNQGGTPNNNGSNTTNNETNNTTNNTTNNETNNETNNQVAEPPVPAHIALDITDDRETFTVGDILTYEINYQNVSNTQIDDVFIKVELPDNTEFLSAGEGVYLRKEHAAVFDLGDLEEDEDGDVKVNVRVVTALREGTRVAAAAIVFYTNPTTGSQASAVHYDINEYDSDGRPAAGATSGGFLPRTFLGWLVIVILLLVIVLVGRRIYLRYKEQKEQEQAEKELQDVISRELSPNDTDLDNMTKSAIESAPQSIDDIEPQIGQEVEGDEGDDFDSEDPWGESEEDELEKKKKDFLDNLPS